MEPAKVRKEDIVLKHLMCAALLASALLAAGCLTGCSSLYDPSDVEDPAGVGTSALLGEDAGAEVEESDTTAHGS